MWTWLLLSCVNHPARAEPKIEKLPTMVIEINQQQLQVEVADEAHERSRGLMYRQNLAKGEGMLFVYPDTKMRSFWMKNTLIPLSIAFIDADGRILNIEDMTPKNLVSVPSVAPAQYALEVPQGWFSANSIAAGDRLQGLKEIESQ